MDLGKRSQWGWVLASAVLAACGESPRSQFSTITDDERNVDCLALDRVDSPLVVPPAGLRVGFRALRCDGGPLPLLRSADVTVINDETGVEFGAGGEGDSVSRLATNSDVELYSLLVLDLSSSIVNGGVLDDAIDGALEFVEETESGPASSLRHLVGVAVFGRPGTFSVRQAFTTDTSQLRSVLTGLRGATSLGTTDLYNAYMDGLELLEAQTGTASYVERNLILLTDGTHEAGDEENLRAEALSAKQMTTAATYIVGVRGEYDACRLEELAGGADSTCREGDACTENSSNPGGCNSFFADVSSVELSDVFSVVAGRALGLAQSNYEIAVCTPVALGEPSLTIRVKVGDASDEATVSYSVEQLTGDLSACDAQSLIP